MRENNSGVLWVRVSSEEQTHGYSPDAQERLLKKAAEEKGIDVIKSYRVAETGSKSAARRQFKSMLAFIEERGIGILVVEKTDRLLRNAHDLSKIYTLIEDRGLSVFLVKEGRKVNKASTPSEKLFFNMAAAVATWQAEMIGSEAKKGMTEKARQGWYPARCPLGYRNVQDPKDQTKRIIEVDKSRSPLIKETFELYASGGYSLSTLQKEMKRRGLRTKETSRVPNAPVTEHGLQAILKNPFYTGRFRWSGQVWEGKYPPLISKKLFDRVRVQLERNCSNPKAGAKKSFLFSPFLRCGLCRHSMSAETHHGLTYYRCNHTQDKNCKQGFFREERVDELFAEALGTLYVDDSIASKIKEHLRSSNLEKEDESARERKRLSSRLTQMDDRLSMAYQDRLDGHISLERYKEVEMGIQEEMSQVQADLSRLGVRNLQYKSEGSQVLELVRGFKETYLRADREGKAQILRIVLHRCYIRGDKGEDSYFEFHEPFNTLFAMGKILKERRAHPFEKRSLKGE